MPQPPCSGLSDLSDSWDVSCRVPDLDKNFWLHSVQEARENSLARLPHDHQDRSCYKKTNEWVGKWVAQPHPDCSEQDSKASPPIRPGMVPISHKSGAADFSPDPDTKNGNRLIADESYYRGRCDRPQKLDGLGIEEPVDGLISGNCRTEKDD